MSTKTKNMKNDLKWNNAAGQHLRWFKAKQAKRAKQSKAKASKGANLVVAIDQSSVILFFLSFSACLFYCNFFPFFFVSFFCLLCQSIDWLIFYSLFLFFTITSIWISNRKWLNGTHVPVLKIPVEDECKLEQSQSHHHVDIRILTLALDSGSLDVLSYSTRSCAW